MSDNTANFRQACHAEVNDRIRNQVLVNRLTATSSKITKISRLEMLIDNRELDINCLDKSHAWRLRVNMYNLNDFVCCIPRMKREFRASFHQSTKFAANIDRQTKLYGTFASICHWFQNNSPIHTFAMDCETLHCNWAAPCYFHGASSTGSSRWGYCLQRVKDSVPELVFWSIWEH